TPRWPRCSSVDRPGPTIGMTTTRRAGDHRVLRAAVSALAAWIGEEVLPHRSTPSGLAEKASAVPRRRRAAVGGVAAGVSTRSHRWVRGGVQPTHASRDRCDGGVRAVVYRAP